MTFEYEKYRIPERDRAIERLGLLDDMRRNPKPNGVDGNTPDPDRDFKLMYAMMVAGLPLNTGARLF